MSGQSQRQMCQPHSAHSLVYSLRNNGLMNLVKSLSCFDQISSPHIADAALRWLKLFGPFDDERFECCRLTHDEFQTQHFHFRTAFLYTMWQLDCCWNRPTLRNGCYLMTWNCAPSAMSLSTLATYQPITLWHNNLCISQIEIFKVI